MLMVADAAEASTDPGAKTKPKRVIKQRQSLSEKQTGTTIFPISRIKKICKADKDLDILTSEATFMVAVATVSWIIPTSVEQADQEGIFHQTFHGGGMYES
jgi:DNA polymerase epsilon subunit 4